jgi:hypothetical protein
VQAPGGWTFAVSPCDMVSNGKTCEGTTKGWCYVSEVEDRNQFPCSFLRLCLQWPKDPSVNSTIKLPTSQYSQSVHQALVPMDPWDHPKPIQITALTLITELFRSFLKLFPLFKKGGRGFFSWCHGFFFLPIHNPTHYPY